jgi:hypothetical protein
LDLLVWLFTLPYRWAATWPTHIQVAMVVLGVPAMLTHFVFWVRSLVRGATEDEIIDQMERDLES